MSWSSATWVPKWVCSSHVHVREYLLKYHPAWTWSVMRGSDPLGCFPPSAERCAGALSKFSTTTPRFSEEHGFTSQVNVLSSIRANMSSVSQQPVSWDEPPFSRLAVLSGFETLGETLFCRQLSRSPDVSKSFRSTSACVESPWALCADSPRALAILPKLCFQRTCSRSCDHDSPLSMHCLKAS